MNVQLRFNCVQILILSSLIQSLQPYCVSEFLRDTSSNADIIDLAEEQRYSPDSSIEQIFRAPRDQKAVVADSKRSSNPETNKLFSSPEARTDKRARVKRENTKRSNSKKLSAGDKSDAKRSPSGKASSRADRSSRGSSKFSGRNFADYGASVDQDKSEYANEEEDESAAENRDSKYKTGEYRAGDDSEKFIDQDERSSLYDDFEVKDVVKRGISGAEDYEEVNEEFVDGAEDAASLDESEAFDEQTDKKKIHGDTRVKRERKEGSRGMENLEVVGKEDNAAISSDSAKEAEAPLKDVKKEVALAEAPKSGIDKDSSERMDESKIELSNIAENREKDVSKINSDAPLRLPNEQPLVRSENAKMLNEEGQEMQGDEKALREIGVSSDAKASSDLNNIQGIPKQDELKVVADANPEPTKIEVPVLSAEAQAVGSPEKLESSGVSEAASSEQMDADYEKRMEEQIQQKIDSIKEQIKREIAESQKLNEIESNNARFDELLDDEDEELEQEQEQEQALQSESMDSNENLSKRSVKNSGKAQARETAVKRSIQRRKRQNDSNQEKLKSSGAENLNGDKKLKRRTMRKRSASKLNRDPLIVKTLSKRQYPREVFLVKRDRNARKKRRRRSKNVKLEDNLPADVSLHGDFKDIKQSGSSSRLAEDGKAIADQSSLIEKKSGSVASLTENEELNPLASEYGDAFGGLNSEPGLALARFKRIKRVLRPPPLKT